MSRGALALGLLLAAAAAHGQAPAGGDLDAFAPVLKEIESRMALCEDVVAAEIQVPAPVIELGLSTKLYRCWSLRLTSERGRQAHETLNQLRGLQKTMAEIRERLARDIAQHRAEPDPGGPFESRIIAQGESLAALLGAYRHLLALVEKSGLARIAEKSMFRRQRSVVPVLKDDDYTMTYESGLPGCPPPQPGGNPRRPSGV